MNKGATIKTVIIGAVLAFCIAGVWMVSAEQIDSVETAERIIVTEQNVPNSEFDVEKAYKEIEIENPVHFGRTIPAWNKYEGIEVTSFGTHDTEGSNTDAGTVSTDIGSEMLGVSIPEEADTGDITGGDSESTEGTEYADAATEYYDAAQEIPVEEYAEEPVEDIPAPEESTFVEEPVAEPEPIVEEPVAEEPVVEEPTEPQMEYLGDWTISFYCNCSQCCGSWSGGPTASGAMPTPWYTVATGDLPFGTILYIDGFGTFEVQDRGTGYGWADVFVSDHGEALANGLQTRAVYIVR